MYETIRQGLTRSLWDIFEQVAAALRALQVPATARDVAFFYALVAAAALLGWLAGAP